MLPAVKVFAVAALLGGGAVGTFALAGGFGPGGSGSGNGETTTQVAAPEVARPAVTEPVAPVPEVAPTPPAAGAARTNGDGAVNVGVQQEAGVVAQRDTNLGTDDQTQKQSGLQTSDPVSSQPQPVDGTSEGQGVDATGKANTESVGETRGTSHVEQEVTSSDSQTGPQGAKGSEGVQSDVTIRANPEVVDQARVPASSSTVTQLSGGDGASGDQGATEGRKVDGETNDAIAAGPEGTPGVLTSGSSPSASTTDAQSTDADGINTGDTTSVVRGTGTEGEETRTASGEESTISA